MAIRLRLALWYGGLFATILLAVTAFSYAFHARGHYDDIDRALVTTAGHAVDEATVSGATPQLVEGKGGFRVILRLYGASGDLLTSSPDAENAPAEDPRIVVQHPAGPAFDAVAAIAPPVVAPDPPAGGVFGLTTLDGARWRLFVLPVHRGAAIVGYVEAAISLADIDRSMQTLRLLLLGLALVGLAVALVGSCLVAGVALRPVSRLIETASAIARSRDLACRVVVPRHRDEIGRLARTFNEMLESIEQSYRAQQRFVSDASHELRAPLTAIQANLELLERHADMPAAERAEAVTEAMRESSRLARLVADLLALARADAGVPVKRFPVDLDVLVLETFGVARQLAHGQTLDLDPFEVASIDGDEDRLKQLLLILLDNALKYTPAGGNVRVGLQRTDGHVEVIVRDTGVGIAERDLPHVSERFYRADSGPGP